MSDADPQQQVVTADNGVRQSGPKGPQRAVTAETPAVWLLRRIDRRLREARRAKAQGEWNGNKSLVDYCDGVIDVLVGLSSELHKMPRTAGVGGNGPGYAGGLTRSSEDKPL